MIQRSFVITKEASRWAGLFLVVLLCACNHSNTEKGDPVWQRVGQIFQADLSQSILYLDSLSQTANTGDAQRFYKAARQSFKYAEPVLTFLDAENYQSLNGPNLTKVSEEDPTDIKINAPFGFQVLEETLFSGSPDVDYNFIHKQAQKTAQRLQLVANTHKTITKERYHLMWIIRDAIIRVALTGITGFDSPALSQSLQEARWVYERLNAYIQLFDSPETQKEIAQWNASYTRTLAALATDFDSFDRYHFIKNQTHEQMVWWKNFSEKLSIQFPFDRAIRNDATSLFSTDTFNPEHFSDHHYGTDTPAKIALGKKLFNDTRLSASGTMSCATCHQQEKAFTDGLRVFPKQTRNTPTLPYTQYQQAFFADNRAGSLEGQILSVVANKNEFHTTPQEIEAFIQQDSTYQTTFAAVFKTAPTEDLARHAMATYIRSLSPFNSKFDDNINSKRNDLSAQEINGFNLFTGKAACATCHFAPTFHGTVPTRFNDTELEALGVPQTADTIHASIDPDLGRYHVMQTEERKFFFKTPTVRNVALTSPYMHNGVYENLEQVVDFYNRGGGAGIGIQLESQTLPPEPLNLSQQEQADLIAFMKTLSDTEY